jgi:hypothetical protein
MERRPSTTRTAAVLILAVIPACGGGGGSPPSTLPPATLPPAAAIQTTGRGALVVHPSTDPARAVALETPITVTETAGGTVDWNFARMSLFKGGIEIERAEIGSDIIKAGGFGRIQPRSTVMPTLVFRFNSNNFDTVQITLGFGDINNGRLFTVDVPFGSFTGVNISPTPLSVPAHGTVTRGTP